MAYLTIKLRLDCLYAGYYACQNSPRAVPETPARHSMLIVLIVVVKCLPSTSFPPRRFLSSSHWEIMRTDPPPTLKVQLVLKSVGENPECERTFLGRTPGAASPLPSPPPTKRNGLRSGRFPPVRRFSKTSSPPFSLRLTFNKKETTGPIASLISDTRTYKKYGVMKCRFFFYERAGCLWRTINNGPGQP